MAPALTRGNEYMRILIRASAAAIAALAIAAGGAAAASAAPASAGHWRFSYVSHQQLGNFTGVAAVSARDVWAVGTAVAEGGPTADRAIVRRWNGSSWSAVALPAADQHAYLTAVAGSAPGNVWVFGYLNGKNGPAPFALRWNGSWSRRGTWDSEAGLINDAVALSPYDIWAFGPGPVQHYNGTHWKTLSLPFSLVAASAISATDMWAIGQGSGGPILAHFAGGRWSTRPVPAKASSFTNLNSVLALPHGKVWVTGEAIASSSSALALQFTNGKWSTHNPPKDDYLGSLTPDGSGGLWAASASPYDGQAVYHYTAGRWHRVVLPSVKGKSTSVSVVARVPGSNRVFAAGLLLWGHLPATEGAILEYSG
jgi:hypothetical protein